MVGERIRRLRESRGIEQMALGRALNASQQTISKIENGQTQIAPDMLIRVATYFDVTTDYLLGLTDVKRSAEGQQRMNEELDRYYDMILRYKNLNEPNRKTFQVFLKRLEEAQFEMECQRK